MLGEALKLWDALSEFGQLAGIVKEWGLNLRLCIGLFAIGGLA